jgi:hypothetical protein
MPASTSGLMHSFSTNYSRSLIEQVREQMGAPIFERVQQLVCRNNLLNFCTSSNKLKYA